MCLDPGDFKLQLVDDAAVSAGCNFPEGTAPAVACRQEALGLGGLVGHDLRYLGTAVNSRLADCGEAVAAPGD